MSSSLRHSRVLPLFMLDREPQSTEEGELVETVKKSVSELFPLSYYLLAHASAICSYQCWCEYWGIHKELEPFCCGNCIHCSFGYHILGMVYLDRLRQNLGTTIIAIFAAAGGNPLLAAIMLPVITGAMEGMTPPLALCMYTAMGIAGSKFKETTINCLIWVGLHYAMAVICLLGILPIMGL